MLESKWLQVTAQSTISEEVFMNTSALPLTDQVNSIGSTTSTTADLDAMLLEITKMENEFSSLTQERDAALAITKDPTTYPAQRKVAGLKVLLLQPEIVEKDAALAAKRKSFNDRLDSETADAQDEALRRKYSTPKAIEARRPYWTEKLTELPAYVLEHHKAATTEVTRTKWAGFRQAILEVKADLASSSDVRLAAAQKILSEHKRNLLAEFSADPSVKTEMLQIFIQAIDDLPADATISVTDKAF
jgi:hypothetical protein